MPTYPNYVSLEKLVDRLKNLGFRVEYRQRSAKVGVLVRRCGQLHILTAVIQARGLADKIPEDVVENIRRKLQILPETGVDNDKFWKDM